MPDQPKRAPKPVGTIQPARKSKSRRRTRQLPSSLLATVVVLGLGAGGWWFLTNQQKAAPAIEASTSAQTVVSKETSTSKEDSLVQPETEPSASLASDGTRVPEPVQPVESTPVAEEKPAASTDAAPAPSAPVSFDRLIVLDDTGGAKKENAAWNEESLKLALKSGQWEDYQALLGRSLRALSGSKNDTSAVTVGRFSGPALICHAFISAVTPSGMKSLLEDEKTADQLQWMLRNPAAMQSFTVQAGPKDNLKKALKIWSDISEQATGGREDYIELAVACALVFDREIKDNEGKLVHPSQRFTYFKANSENGHLAAKIKKMSAAELVWVVGVPVNDAELEWALKEADFRQKSWGQAYDYIKYDMEKAVTGKNPYDTYTFAEIKKKGGVCGDRAYFSAWTACARGIPAAIIGGDGSRGPHAWMTWMADEGEWEFSGRFSGYPAGHCRCPQTGENISEEEFLRLSDKKASDHARFVRAHQAIWMADVFDTEPERCIVFLSEAVRSAPKLADPSAALLDHWMDHKGNASVEEWNTFIRGLRKDFRDSESLMKEVAKAEKEFVFERQNLAETMKNLRREAKKADDTAANGAGMEADIGRLTATYKTQAELLKKSGDLDGIRTVYRRALADHGDNAASFKALTKDLFSFMKEDGDMAIKTCRDLESACRRYVGRGKGDWFDVTSQNSAWRAVADCYRKAGDTKKADSIAQDCASREKVAKKKAI